MLIYLSLVNPVTACVKRHIVFLNVYVLARNIVQDQRFLTFV